MRLLASFPLIGIILFNVTTQVHAASCAGKTDILGVSRVVALDTSLGQRFGRMQYKEDTLLADREVVLTFDDGPLPRYTKPILKALADHCTKATFFYVGKMAKAYPDMLKRVYAEGHTIAGHTYSHPLNLKRRSLATAKYEIERGFMTLEAVLGNPIAPFFRFPGLSDSKPLMAYLRQRKVGMFSVDVVSNDSYTRSPKRLTAQTMKKLDRLGRGILLFHDIKASTARALPNILAQLKAKGYRVVHIKAQTTFKPLVNDQKKLKQAIANVPNKKWISFKRLTGKPIPLPEKRVTPEANITSNEVPSEGAPEKPVSPVTKPLLAKPPVENADNADKAAITDKEGVAENIDDGSKKKGSSLLETHKTASLTTGSTDVNLQATAKKIAPPTKKPARRRVKGWVKKQAKSAPFNPFDFLKD